MQDHDVSTSLELHLAAESEAAQCGCVESLMIPDESSAFSGRLCQFRGSRRELGLGRWQNGTVPTLAPPQAVQCSAVRAVTARAAHSTGVGRVRSPPGYLGT